MMGGPAYEYLWADGDKIKTPIKCSAPEYVSFLMDWVDNQLSNERLFPTQAGLDFPPGFFDIVRNIFRRLFRVYAHIYHAHFERMRSFGAEAHLNSCFKHFLYFVQEFDLVRRYVCVCVAAA